MLFRTVHRWEKKPSTLGSFKAVFVKLLSSPPPPRLCLRMMLLLIFTEEEWDVHILSQCAPIKYLPDPEMQTLKHIYNFTFSGTKQLKKPTVHTSGDERLKKKHIK